MEDIK